MKKIGLTGGIGTGKTYVAKIFQKFGIPVFCADANAKELLQTNLKLINQVRKEFGSNIYIEGVLQSKELADIVFSDKSMLVKLNKLVHPYVNQSFISWCTNQESNLVIKEAAILFESNANIDLDIIICVAAPLEIRIKRVKKRDGVSEEHVQRVINNQMLQNKKEKLSDFVIYNDEKKLILPQIIEILKILQ